MSLVHRFIHTSGWLHPLALHHRFLFATWWPQIYGSVWRLHILQIWQYLLCYEYRSMRVLLGGFIMYLLPEYTMTSTIQRKGMKLGAETTTTDPWHRAATMPCVIIQQCHKWFSRVVCGRSRVACWPLFMPCAADSYRATATAFPLTKSCLFFSPHGQDTQQGISTNLLPTKT